MGKIVETTLEFVEIARRAGFHPGPDGKLNLPARDSRECQATADRLAGAATMLVADIQLGRDDRLSVVLTGPGPVWGYLSVAHALHGRCALLTYSAPNGSITVWSHGV